MKYEEITEKIIGCAYKVFNKLGFGYLESVYQNALILELEKEGLEASKEDPINVYYEDTIVGFFKADIIVNKLIILELKSVQNLVKEFEVQVVNYLTATKLNVGLIINFGPKGIEIKRKVRLLENLNA
jgi:GxxExxY protein